MLEWLDANPGHHAAESLVVGTGLPKATVYHALGQLGDAALLLTAEAGAGKMFYESAAEPHHHFVCRSCGRMFDTPCAPGDAPCLTVDVPGVVVEQADVILRGRCVECAAAHG